MAYINMSCGQTFLSPSALKRMGQQVNQPIYYPDYYETEVEVVKMLKEVYKTDNKVVIATGTGTYGIEMGLRSTFEPGEKVIVINTGVFGAVSKSILEILGITPVELKFEYGCAVDIEAVKSLLEKDMDIKGLYVVHDETTTGAIQPIQELGKLCREYNIIFAVDAISSIAGVELETDKWGIDLCFGSAQKCMNGPQGLVTIAVSERVYEKISRRKTPIDSLSLDLETWTRYHEFKVKKYLEWWKNGGEAPKFISRAPHEVSPPATLIWGLQGALEDILAEGLEKRIKRHEKAGKAVRNAIDALGLKRVTEDEELVSDVVTVVRLPEGIMERDFREHMLKKYNVALGNGEIGNDNVRIGTMGISALPKYVFPTIAAFGNTLRHFGVKIDSGAALAAADKVFQTIE
jgi:aspartate aminotransferase-like enzyme